MGDVLVDTDVFVDHLRGARAMTAAVEGTISYSVITRAELFAGQRGDEDTINVLLGPFSELSVDRAIAERAGRLRRTLPIRMPDALIAATALERGLDLMTRNRRDFERVQGLTLRDPA